MATIERFEDIEAWQKARELVKAVYGITSEGAFAQDFGLRDQIRRAVVSVLSNIAEGFERSGDKEFSQFLAVAKGSCGVVRAQLYVAMDQRYINSEQFDTLSGNAVEISRLLAGLMTYLRESQYRGSKFK